jgi:hypothetical protein
MRIYGNALEYIFCKFLKHKNYKEYDQKTSTRYKKLELDCYHLYSKRSDLLVKLEKIDKCFQLHNIHLPDVGFFSLNTDNSGRHGDASDIIIHPKGKECKAIKISLKNNNASIKHQRPNNLHNQLKLSIESSKLFKEEYELLEKKFLKQIKPYGLYNLIPCDIKNDMYQSINDLVLKWLNKYKNTSYTRHFLSFLIGQKDCCVIKWTNKTQSFSLINPNIKTRLNINNIYIKGNAIYIHINNNYVIKMRIHTASTSICDKLNVKYDSVLKNIQ